MELTVSLIMNGAEEILIKKKKERKRRKKSKKDRHHTLYMAHVAAVGLVKES